MTELQVGTYFPSNYPHTKQYPITINLSQSMFQLIDRLVADQKFKTYQSFYICAILHWHKYWDLSPNQIETFFQSWTPILKPLSVLPSSNIEWNQDVNLISAPKEHHICTLNVDQPIFRLLNQMYSRYIIGYSRSEFMRSICLQYLHYLFTTADFPIFRVLTIREQKRLQIKHRNLEMIAFGQVFYLRNCMGGRKPNA